MKEPGASTDHAQQVALAERLERARLAAGLSLEQAAARSSLPANVIEKYEQQHLLAPNAHVVARLASTYSVSTDYLLGLTEDDDLPSGTFVVYQGVVDEIRAAKEPADFVDLIEWTPTFIPFWDVVGPNRKVSSKSEVYTLSLELETKISSLGPDLVNSYMQGLLTMSDLRDEALRRLGRDV